MVYGVWCMVCAYCVLRIAYCVFCIALCVLCIAYCVFQYLFISASVFVSLCTPFPIANF